MGGTYSLHRSRNFIPRELKPKLAQSLLFPYFNYCDSVYQDMSVELSIKIQKLQNSCVRFSCGLHKYDHVSPYYDLLKWDRCADLRKFHLLCIVYQCLHNDVFPSYMKDMYVILSDSHGRATRSKDAFILKLPLFNLRAFHFSFQFQGAIS
jgi:hypothetical protein